MNVTFGKAVTEVDEVTEAPVQELYVTVVEKVADPEASNHCIVTVSVAVDPAIML